MLDVKRLPRRWDWQNNSTGSVSWGVRTYVFGIFVSYAIGEIKVWSKLLCICRKSFDMKPPTFHPTNRI
jgi:hypothetical protein